MVEYNRIHFWQESLQNVLDFQLENQHSLSEDDMDLLFGSYWAKCIELVHVTDYILVLGNIRGRPKALEAGDESRAGNPLLTDFILAGKKLEKPGFKLITK